MSRNRNIILILLVGFFLRLINLNQSFWLDEGAQVVMSQQPLLFQWVGRGSDFHPPLFYVIMHFFLQVSDQEWFLRLPSVIAGVATIYFIYKISKEYFNEKVAIISAVLLAVSPFHIYYSQEARMYGLFALLATISMYLFKKKEWIFYYMVTALMLYTHYVGFFVIFSQLIWVLIFNRKEIVEHLESILIAVLPIVLWVPQLIKQLSTAGELLTVLPSWREVATLSSIKAIPLLIFKFSFGRISFDDKYLYAIILIIVLGIFSFLAMSGLRKINESKLYVVNWLSIPILGIFLISFFSPMFQPFRLLFTIVPFYILLSLGINAITNKIISRIFLALLVVISLTGLGMYHTNIKFQREDWRSAVNFVEYHDAGNSLSLFEFSSIPAPYAWYRKEKTEAVAGMPRLGASAQEVNVWLDGQVKKNNVYLFQYLQPMTDPQENIKSWLLDKGYRLINTYDFSGVGFVYNFRKIN